MRRVLLIGHKGASSIAPENTLKAFQKAIDLEADYIEFDLHLSKDNKIVISHDFDTERITGYHGVIKEMTLKELKRLDFGEGEKIPTLTELIFVAKGKIGLQPEIKTPGIVKKLAKILRKENLISDTIVSSFSFDELIKLQKINSDIKLGLLLPEAIKSKHMIKRKIQKIIDKKLYSIHPFFENIDEELVNFSHANNLKVIVWTVDDEIKMSNLVNIGVDGIITNDIQLAKKVLHRL